ncbi:MAG: hypothetical protein R3264_15520, partial [Anaerolineae bacterium]|nr:hypothetical protein [Anaerolineae bacterium]
HEELADYQRQMTIIAALEPERYRENKVPLPLWQIRVGIIYQNKYYLLPICQANRDGWPIMYHSLEANTQTSVLQPDTDGNLSDRFGTRLTLDRSGRVYDLENNLFRGYLLPTNFMSLRRQIAAIIENAPPTVDRNTAQARPLDVQLIAIDRSSQERARKKVTSEAVQNELLALKHTPVLINWDLQAADKPLAYIRRGRRGIGDHALTIFRTPTSMVFDQSHIFFDGIWGIALSEILTGEAISWAAYLRSLAPAKPATTAPYSIRLDHEPGLVPFEKSEPVEVSAESSHIDVKLLYRLLKFFSQRGSGFKLTINDLLIFYRGEFGREYHPSAQLQQRLAELAARQDPQSREANLLIEQALVKARTVNPSIMIPMDANAAKPHERLFPTTFRNPFTDLWANYQQANKTLRRYKISKTAAHWSAFTEARNLLLIQLNYLGQLLRAYKDVAMMGGSPSTASLKLMAHVPDSLLALFNEIPDRINVMNEVIKGEEVFSNVGRVAQGASLSRFISARDDNENKPLVWGVLTDDDDVMHVSLRDFRPHVSLLYQIGRADLAQLMVEDYLEAFTVGFNQFAAFLSDILRANASHASEGSDDGQ